MYLQTVVLYEDVCILQEKTVQYTWCAIVMWNITLAEQWFVKMSLCSHCGSTCFFLKNTASNMYEQIGISITMDVGIFGVAVL